MRGIRLEWLVMLGASLDIAIRHGCSSSKWWEWAFKTPKLLLKLFPPHLWLFVCAISYLLKGGRNHMRPVHRNPQGLSEKILDRGLGVEKDVGLGWDDLLQILYQFYFLIVKVVPVPAGMVPGICIVVAWIHVSWVIPHSKEVIHRPLSLRRRKVGWKIQVVHRKVDLILNLIIFVAWSKLETFQTDDEDWWQFPDVNFFDGRLMLLTLLAIPLVLPIQILPFAVLSEALLKSQRCLTLWPMSDGDTQIHQTVEFCGSVLADFALHCGL